ncbi:hypothetical protein [Prochlorococcus sp. MIT 1307]|uniref:hypothetical protein n=1 Tax=Prochlorococcus sp. MIT 1307 TaxID=3096219 RepID=UPI002A749949|nr:hypothetical protein [Prochlorococcus sp. MIT 1307]
MTEPSIHELNESIKLLSNYHDRLQEEVISITKKLQMPQAKITTTLNKNSELSNIKQVIINLVEQRDKKLNQTQE